MVQRGFSQIAGLLLVILVFLLSTKAVLAAEQQAWGLSALKPGERLVARLAYRNNSRSDLRPVFQDMQAEHSSGADTVPAPGMVRTVSAIVKGNVEMTMVRQGNDDLIMHLRLLSPVVDFTVDQHSSLEYARTVKHVLADGIWVAMGRRGEVRGVWYGTQLDQVSKSMVATIVSLLQQVAPEKPELSQWNIDEFDQTGLYRVQYQAVAPDMWRKKKKVYLASPTQTDANSQQQVNYRPTGGQVVRFYRDRVLRSLVAAEELQLLIGERVVGYSRTTFELKTSARQRLSVIQAAELTTRFTSALQSVPPQPLFQPHNQEDANRLLYRQKLGNRTIADLMAELEQAEKAGDSFDDTELYLTFKALIYLNPERSLELSRKAIEAPTRSRTFKLLVSALAAIGHPDAQNAILAIIEARSKDVDSLVELLPLLGMFDQPISTVEATLQRFAYQHTERDVTFTAQLALGVMAGKLSATDKKRAQHLLHTFLEQYPKPTSIDAISRVVLVLGNAGMEQYLPEILAHLRDARYEVRVDVIHALRRYPVSLVGTTLIASLSGDRDANVRFEAANALGYMPLDADQLALLLSQYAQERVSAVRSELIKSIWRSVKKNPAVRVFMQRVAADDASEDVRKVAKGLLGQ